MDPWPRLGNYEHSYERLMASAMVMATPASYEKSDDIQTGDPLTRRFPAGIPDAVLGLACGAGAALFWAAGFATARHGILIGFSPADLALHRFAWAGFFFLPYVVRMGVVDLGGIGWRKAIALTLFGGPPLALISYAGFILVPLGHGGVIQPSSATLFGLLFSAVILKEWLPASRLVGAGVIVLGVCLIGIEALATIGHHGILGDLAFVAAGLCFATFAVLLRRWRIAPLPALAVVSVISLVDFPIHAALFGFERMLSFGLAENLLQLFVQGALAGPAAIYLFARAVVLVGPSRAAVFTALVPAFTLAIGYVLIGEVPSVTQFIGMLIVLMGFRLTQRP
jgi:drug/metabolite transporter (DMT)-like permease